MSTYIIMTDDGCIVGEPLTDLLIAQAARDAHNESSAVAAGYVQPADVFETHGIAFRPAGDAETSDD